MAIIIPIAVVLTALYCLLIAVFLFGLAIKPVDRSQEKFSVTVVIAARNEENNIGGILDDLVNQTFDASLFEVIVADDHSTDKTAERVLSYSRRYPFIRLLKVGEIPPAFSPKKFALQQAVEAARGEIILATDADCRVGPNWIRAMVSFFTPEVGFVIGFSQFGRKGEKQRFIERLQAFDFLTLMGAAAATTNLGIPLAASGQNMGYRKSLFMQVGGYRRVARRVSGDDVLLLQLLLRLTGCRARFADDPLAFAVSQPQPNLAALINQRKRWASNGAYQLILNPLFFAYLALVLLFNLSLAVGLVGAAVTGAGVAAVAACFASRALFEGLIAFRSAVKFSRTDLLPYFPLWLLVQIPYIVGVGLAGTFGRFTWKDRVHNAQNL
ncbi:MAG: glycosyltransferase [candidate division KSB1 bacterium]|nr:glycosyltransferase [candidate division KSB1 bacterium]MDZ7345348.1 glycosyltransferase [candidate division KSB1 bacterium]